MRRAKRVTKRQRKAARGYAVAYELERQANLRVLQADLREQMGCVMSEEGDEIRAGWEDGCFHCWDAVRPWGMALVHRRRCSLCKREQFMGLSTGEWHDCELSDRPLVYASMPAERPKRRMDREEK